MKKCNNCGSDDVYTEGEQVLYSKKEGNTIRTRLLQLYLCGECGRKLVGE